VWLLKKKNGDTMAFGRAVSLALVGLTAGAVVGGALEGWLRVDLVPIGRGLHSYTSQLNLSRF